MSGIARPSVVDCFVSAGVLGAGACLLAVPGTAIAQVVSTPEPAAAGDEAASPSAGGLSEIIVTAQRRAENLQDVPIAVSAITAEALEQSGIDATRDLPQVIPSVQFSRSGASGLFFIRGVGTTNASGGEEGANAVYIDNVYIGDLNQTITNFNNIERIEVLKGPQGTLFGRNATGGLIHIITREPGDTLEGEGEFGIANYETLTGQFYVGGPLSDKISADVAVSTIQQNDGWGRNLTLNREARKQRFKGVRSKLVFRATDDVKFTLSGDYSKSRDDLGLAWKVDPGVFVADPFGMGPPVTGPSGHDTTSNFPSFSAIQAWGVSLIGEIDLGLGTLTSISAMRRLRNHSEFDIDGSPYSLNEQLFVNHARTYQQEVRLASNETEPLSWQVGLFYLKSQAFTDDSISQGGVLTRAGRVRNNIFSDLDTNSYAAFAEATYTFGGRTHLTAGLRYTKDKRDFDGRTVTLFQTGATSVATNDIKELNYDRFTYRAALRHEITEDINVYASVNHGFKAGTFSISSPTAAPVEPQLIWAYEAGIKSEFFDRRLRVNLSAYHYDIDDYQIRVATGNTLTGTSTVLLNAASAKVDGVDLEFEAAPTDAWRIFGGATILDSRFGTFGGPGQAIQAGINYPAPASCPAALVGTRDPGVLGPGPRTGGIVTCAGDVSGLRTALAPKFTASLGTSYTIALSETSELRFTGNYSYNSGYVFDPDNKTRQGSFSLFNASMEYRPDEDIGIEIWGKNLTDKEYSVQKLTTAFGTTTSLGAPRTYGVNLNFYF